MITLEFTMILSSDIKDCREQWADRSDKPPLSLQLAVPKPEWGTGKPDDGYH